MISTVSDDPANQAGLQMIPGDRLMRNPLQPRQIFDGGDIDRLSRSIKRFGILQPLRVRYDPVREKWLIIIGECRWIAGQRAGVGLFPALPWLGGDDADVYLAQLAENTARNGLRPVEQAKAFANARKANGLDADELAEVIGVTGGTVSKSEALLKLPIDVQAMVDDGRISAVNGYYISRLPDEGSMREFADAVAERRLVGEALASAVREAVGKKGRTKPSGGRLSLPLPGLSLSLASDQPMTWDLFHAAMGQIAAVKRIAKEWQDAGGDVAELGDRLREQMTATVSDGKRPPKGA